MGNILYTIVIIFVAMWAIEFLICNAGGIIHLLLATAAIVLVIRIIRGPDPA